MTSPIFAMHTIAIISLVTIVLRILPFMIFNKRKTPSYIIYLGKVLPFSIMGMLVIYCLKSTKISSAPYGIPVLCSCVLVIILHAWKRNTLLSIGAGTLLYMLCV